ncbi:Ethanolamine ammonia-lyase light chain [Jatrophihabitans endophyticus]|uniref:Ethanolamine ammonia-lyase small subunit n=1 Tax=Jatrophihabitans endophyticus TaxID=1206085 RepID=A0A1M5SUG0_9ACTN|nr:ethanolamine ammonia-lyase subunit EutC [Jatrophihabitans endophyticus]SHH42144.1 Ethanolamine ammonia-lyase light chain [Jatrophihabitans endophyticus]
MSDPLWDELRRTTRARIGLGRAGNALPTTAVLELAAAHAAARDAVHEALDVDALAADLVAAGFPEPVRTTSRAGSRAEYLRRPDLGRVPAGADGPFPVAGDLAVVLADGLSARALQAHAVPLLRELRPLLDVGTPVIATQARVALGDHLGARAGAAAVLVLIGERPGLSASDSLGAYLTWAPTPGRSDAQRNCVSNIRPPDGLDYPVAARNVAGLLRAARELGESGVRLKDRSRAALAAADPGPVADAGVLPPA